MKRLVVLGLALLWCPGAWCPPSPNIALSCTNFSFTTYWPGAAAETIAPAAGATCTATQGTANGQYTLNLPGTSNLTNGTNTVSVGTWTSSPTPCSAASPCTLNASGGATITVGATRAALLSNQVAGDYTSATGYTVKITDLTQNKSGSGHVFPTLHVLIAIQLLKVGDLLFGSTWRGGAAQTVAAASGASFTVSGEGGRAYTVTSPTGSTSVSMTTTATGAGTNTITVDTFTLSPASGWQLSGSAGTSGSQTLYVGATRHAIATDQLFGDYSGSFTVTVSY